jgi:hypothetical protein
MFTPIQEAAMEKNFSLVKQKENNFSLVKQFFANEINIVQINEVEAFKEPNVLKHLPNDAPKSWFRPLLIPNEIKPVFRPPRCADLYADECSANSDCELIHLTNGLNFCVTKSS